MLSTPLKTQWAGTFRKTHLLASYAGNKHFCSAFRHGKERSLISHILSALNVNHKGSENLQPLGRSGQMEAFTLVTS